MALFLHKENKKEREKSFVWVSQEKGRRLQVCQPWDRREKNGKLFLPWTFAKKKTCKKTDQKERRTTKERKASLTSKFFPENNFDSDGDRKKGQGKNPPPTSKRRVAFFYSSISIPLRGERPKKGRLTNKGGGKKGRRKSRLKIGFKTLKSIGILRSICAIFLLL